MSQSRLSKDSVDDLDIPLHQLRSSQDDEEDDAPLIQRNDSKANFDHNDVGKNRVVKFGLNGKFASNAVSNAKYSFITFLPLCLFEQFKFFFNLYFLLVALSQFVPALRIGYLSTYIAPLCFVLCVTLGKEALDDLTRRRRDRAANSTHYEVLGKGIIQSRDVSVGDLIHLEKDARVPADCVLLRAEGGEAFIRTDQLDGETDWKLRIACPVTQSLTETEILESDGQCICEPPAKAIHSFVGTASVHGVQMPLSCDNTLWANTVIASSTVLGLVIYTGRETRQAMNTSKAGTKTGLLEHEINFLSKLLCLLTIALSAALVVFHGIGKDWYIAAFRFLILFSTIIPISLRVNLDLGKTKFAYDIEHDKDIGGTVVRTSSIPEDLGRIDYLLTDKTGTLTQNEMEMKKLHIGTVSYAADDTHEIASFLEDKSTSRARRGISQRVRDAVWALAICHNVTPIMDEGSTSYQAASPDEVAIVKWCATVGLRLEHRDRQSMVLKNGDVSVRVEILHIFPFSSDSKRMGIVVKIEEEIWFFQKGADVVMCDIVLKSDWLEEECGNMAREGLRTLVVGRRRISNYERFAQQLSKASMSFTNRDTATAAVIQTYLERDLELLGITGVEDRLQLDVKPSLELLRNGGIKIWMLTGDKVETARCVAISSRLVRKTQSIVVIEKCDTGTALSLLEQLDPHSCLLIDGFSLQNILDGHRQLFIRTARVLPSVVACRCSPTQKAELALLIKKHTGQRICCIGDGGNDVSMIQAADVGIGIAGKEGRQASLASDFSIESFCHIIKLFMWHGRNAYRNNAKIAQLVIHRGLIIAICQVVYSVATKFQPHALYQGWLMVGYATVYTMMPLFSLVLDRDVPSTLTMMYPELYFELKHWNYLGVFTFLLWVLTAIYQGALIMSLTIVMVGLDSENSFVVVSYTALVMNELIMISMEITTWHRVMIAVQLLTLVLYVASVPFLGDYFNLEYVQGSPAFYWKTAIILTTVVLPPWLIRTLHSLIRPPNYTKLRS